MPRAFNSRPHRSDVLLTGKESSSNDDFELSHAAELQQCSPDAGEGVGHFGCELDDCAIAVGRLAILAEGLARPRETKPRAYRGQA